MIYRESKKYMGRPGKLKKPATMRDVARLAGVSQPTVSRVLNETDTSISISDQTREKVLAAVEELHYRPNMHARSLRTTRTNMIAVLIADITNSFYPQIARTIQEIARVEGYDVMIANSDHVYENEKHFCEAIKRRAVDGVILVPIYLTEQDLDDLYRETNTPISILGQHLHHPKVDVVYADDEKATYDAATWLIEERGHQSVGYLGVPDDLPPGPRRYRGYTRGLEAAGMPINPAHTFTGDFTLNSGRKVGEALLKMDDPPSALLVANDSMALGVLLTVQEGGMRIPEDIAIVGYDDIPEARLVRPALTTIEQNAEDLGRKMATLLFDRIQNPDLPSRRVESVNKLIIRGSA